MDFFISIVTVFIPLIIGVISTYLVHKQKFDWKLDVLVFIITTGVSFVLFYFIIRTYATPSRASLATFGCHLGRI